MRFGSVCGVPNPQLFSVNLFLIKQPEGVAGESTNGVELE